MKITVEISDSEMKEILRMTGQSKKGPAIRKLLSESLALKRRREFAQKFLSCEWGVELKGFEAAQAAQRAAEDQLFAHWSE